MDRHLIIGQSIKSRWLELLESNLNFMNPILEPWETNCRDNCIIKIVSVALTILVTRIVAQAHGKSLKAHFITLVLASLARKITTYFVNQRPLSQTQIEKREKTQLMGTQINNMYDRGLRDFRSYDLRNINLQTSFLCSSDFRGADLRGTRLKGIALIAANLEKTKLTSNQIKTISNTGYFGRPDIVDELP